MCLILALLMDKEEKKLRLDRVGKGWWKESKGEQGWRREDGEGNEDGRGEGGKEEEEGSFGH